MAAIVWDSPADRIFEDGLDRGVLYPESSDGVGWNGLISVDEPPTWATSSVFFDGLKINDLVGYKDASATIRAYTYPEEFLECEGVYEDQRGVSVTGQRPRRFGLSYRTLVGSAVDPGMSAYKIHLWYNLTATPETKTRKSLSLDTTPSEFSWTASGVPEQISGFRPSVHLILDSRKVDPWLMLDIEGILYGDETREPTLPSMKALTTFIRKWDRLIIVDNGDGTWTGSAVSAGYITQTGPSTYDITTDTIVPIDADSYTISSTDKNEEDID